MRIALIHPAGSNWIPGKKDITATANRMAPLGLLSIAAYLKRDGHHVLIHDCLGPEAVAGTEANAREILRFHPDLVGFSTTTSSFPDGYDLALRIKETDASVRTVFGGVHVSALGAALMDGFPAIDYLCPGEGEVTLSELAGGNDPAAIDGLIRREGSHVVVNPPRSRLLEMDQLPFSRLRRAKRIPPRLHPAPLQLHPRARRHHEHQPRLPVSVLLL